MLLSQLLFRCEHKSSCTIINAQEFPAATVPLLYKMQNVAWTKFP
jgi:hypothetical protein